MPPGSCSGESAAGSRCSPIRRIIPARIVLTLLSISVCRSVRAVSSDAIASTLISPDNIRMSLESIWIRVSRAAICSITLGNAALLFGDWSRAVSRPCAGGRSLGPPRHRHTPHASGPCRPRSVLGWGPPLTNLVGNISRLCEEVTTGNAPNVSRRAPDCRPMGPAKARNHLRA